MPRRARQPEEDQPQVVDVFASEPIVEVLPSEPVVDVLNPRSVVDVLAVPQPDEEPTDAPTPVDAPVKPAGPPVPESQLNAEQRRIRELEDALARERGRKDPEPELEAPPRPGAEGNILIHILEDGFTALGKVWYRGQEIEFEPGGPAYRDTCDRRGWSWLELRHDEFAQAAKWGRIMFRVGPWPGKTYAEVAKMPHEPLKPLRDNAPAPGAPSEQELKAAERAEAQRRRAAPRLPVS